MDFQGKVAVVTAGGRGIGRACALALAAEGSHVVIADIDVVGAHAAAEAVRRSGRESLAVCCDVTRDADVFRLAAEVEDRFGRVDLLHNHAGVGVSGPLEEIPLQEWDRVLRVNVISQIRGVRAFIASLRRTRGHIVNTTSSLAVLGGHPLSTRAIPYIASKHAIVGLTQCLAEWARPQGVGVSLLAPEQTATRFGGTVARFGTDGASPPPRSPLPVQTPEDVAAVYIEGLREGRFLLSSTPDVKAKLHRQAEGLLDPAALHDIYRVPTDRRTDAARPRTPDP